MNNSKRDYAEKFWIAFWVTIIVLGIIYFGIIYNIQKNNAEKTINVPIFDRSQIKIINEGQNVLLSDSIADIWGENILGIIDNVDTEINAKTKSEIDALIDEKIDAVFSPIYRQIPIFMNFHYSVTGEYSEIVGALTGEIGNRMQTILFNQIGFEDKLKNGLDNIDIESKEKISGAMGRINENIKNKIGFSNNDMNLLTTTLNLTTQNVKNRFSNLTYNTVRGTGFGLGFATTGKLLSKTIGEKLAVKIAAKTAIKTSVKLGGVLGGASAGAGACAIGGPVAAAVCGAVSGVITWVTVDKLIVEIDEHFNRAEFEQELRIMVDEKKQEIKQGLKKSYANALATLSSEQKHQFKSGVVTPKDLMSN